MLCPPLLFTVPLLVLLRPHLLLLFFFQFDQGRERKEEEEEEEGAAIANFQAEAEERKREFEKAPSPFSLYRPSLSLPKKMEVGWLKERERGESPQLAPPGPLCQTLGFAKDFNCYLSYQTLSNNIRIEL